MKKKVYRELYYGTIEEPEEEVTPVEEVPEPIEEEKKPEKRKTRKRK